ncbi:hypothetical protein [Isoptericola croceus]|uniref:hypothetical protein n=1 Tax=Isoptericola croceus TaxID=3031406 RepID=UPI0023F85EDA|nr:hypothetical protein [Isoptericola croceus]
MELADDPLEPWRALEAVRETLPLETQAIFILLCVESRLAICQAPDGVGQGYLGAIWDSLDGDRSTLSTLSESLSDRPDIDERDELAALLHAIEALRGSHEAAAWGADRLRDDAYERIPRVGDDHLFASLGVDTAHDVVQDELRWQRSLLDAFRTDERVAAGLRERARARCGPGHRGEPL